MSILFSTIPKFRLKQRPLRGRGMIRIGFRLTAQGVVRPGRSMRACLDSPRRAWERAERNEAARGHSFIFIRIKDAFGSMQNPGPRQLNQYERCLLYMPRPIGVHVHLGSCPPTLYIKFVYYLFPFGRAVRHICSRSVGPFGPPKEQKRDSAPFFPLPRYTYCCSSRAARNLFVFRNRAAPIDVANNIPFGIRSNALWGGGGLALLELQSHFGDKPLKKKIKWFVPKTGLRS